MSIAPLDIKIRKVDKSRFKDVNPGALSFGTTFSDHMLIAHYEHGTWKQPEIMPFQNLSFSPATTFFHYGQAIFEGIKAYRDPHGNPIVFRPVDNLARMNRSAERMAMPSIPQDIFIEGMRALVNLDRDWIPDEAGASLYIRPVMLATDEFIGMHLSEKFTFLIITSPTGPYYNHPLSIYVQDRYVRAFPGGVGFAKAAGNYGMSMYPTAQVKNLGYDQILWTDGFTHQYVQEIGTMNVFFVIGNKVITPDTAGDAILEGITRDSIMKLLRENGITLEERPLSIGEIETAYNSGALMEAFGAGTAASIAPIRSLTYQEKKMLLPPADGWEIAKWLQQELDDIRYGRKEDTRDWVLKI